MKIILITTACADKIEAEKIASKLVDLKLCGCVQIDKINSIYNWKNKIYSENEYRLTIKTLKKHYKEIVKFIQSNHSYECPEIISYPMKHASKQFYKWLKTTVK